jgi:aminopeptidase N
MRLTTTAEALSRGAVLATLWCGAALVTPLAAQQPRVERYTFHIELPETGKHIKGDALIKFEQRPAVDTVVLDLDASMKVTAVEFRCDDTAREAKFEHRLNTLRVAIPPKGGLGEPECLRVYYNGTPTDGLIIGTDSAGRWMAFGDNFPNRARYWLPTLDHPSQKAKVTFWVTAPAGREIVANGVKLAPFMRKDGRLDTTWDEDRPIPTYAMVIAAGPLTMHDLGKTACGMAEDNGCVPQMVWTAPEQAKYMPGQFAKAGEIVDFYARTVGPFPYEKLGHLQSTTRYGGMENSSAIFYADRLFRTPNGVGDGLIAHETAHQWFGDAVTEREWAHAWLSEGFATFFAALWTQHSRGDSAYAAEIARLRQQVIAAKVVSERAVIDSVETDPNRLLNANTYQKGGLVLHMLRRQLGDRVFFAGVRAYFAAHKHGNALSQDLQAALEQSSGTQLGWFFDQWLRKPGWAEVRTSWTYDAAKMSVTISAEQGTRFGAYRLPVTVAVSDGTNTVRVPVVLEATGTQSIVLPTMIHSAPTKVTFDPDGSLLAVFTAK